MTDRAEAGDALWGGRDVFVAFARNVSTRYLVLTVEAAIGALLLPFNVRHLGQAEWGLWMLIGAVTVYFSVLDLGFGNSVVRFVAQYRAARDRRGLNEMLSTAAVLLTAVGALGYVVFAAVALGFPALFNVTAEQAATGRTLLLITGLYVALSFPFSVFGALINGFQRLDVNNWVAILTSAAAAAVNVAVLLAGYGLVEVVASTTAIRIAALFFYRLNAYRVFPALSVRPSLFRLARLRELTGFSVYLAVVDWAHRLNYGIDALIVGAVLSPAAVALWMVPRRILEYLQRFTNQVNGVLFPLVVDSAALRNQERLRAIFVQGTRLSLVGVLPPAVALFLLAGPLIGGWVGPGFEGSVVVAQLLACVTVIRVGSATGTTVLKGAGRHRLVAFATLGAAVANVALSLVLIRIYGLPGQAVGTLVPVGLVLLGIVWPAACRRVGLGVLQAFRQAVWPALWPAAAMAAVILPLRGAAAPGLAGAVLVAAAGAVCYALAYLTLAVSTAERRMYLARAVQLMRRRDLPAAA